MIGKGGGDSIPLYSVKSTKEEIKNSELAKLGSCFSDPQSTVLECILGHDHAGLTTVLADTAPVEDSQDIEDNLQKEYSLPVDHWINLPTSKEGKFRTLLHIAIDENDPKSVALLLRAGARADVHNDDLGVSPVHVAVQMNNLDILMELMRTSSNKGDLNVVMRNGRTPLHLAADNNRLEIVKFILERGEIRTVDPEDLMGRQTPLYLAVKKRFTECVRVLLEYGASTLRTVEGNPISEYIAEQLPQFDLQAVKVQGKVRESTAEDLVYSLNRTLDKAQVNRIKKQPNTQNLLNFKTVLQALVTVNRQLLDSSNCGGFTLLQKSCEYGLDEFVSVLLEHGGDPNRTLKENSTPPILLAAYAGHHAVLKVMLQHKIEALEGGRTVNMDVRDKLSQETILHYILRKPRRAQGRRAGVEERDYQQCLDTLLQTQDRRVGAELGRVINRSDLLGNTPLHYATQLWGQDTVRCLLERGANVGLKNNWDETPIEKIRPETMEAFLDEFCLTSKNDIQHEDFELKFRYSFLAPPVDSPYFDEHDEEGQEMVDKQALPETETLWYMSQSRYHRHLLKHPVITSFLWMKWHRIRKHFNRNVRLYLLFVTCLSWFIFEAYGGISYRGDWGEQSERNNTTLCSVNLERMDTSRGFWYSVFVFQSVIQLIMILRDWHRDLKQSDLKTAVQVLLSSWLEFFIITAIIILIVFSTEALIIILSILIVLVATRELLQMMVSLKRYFFDLENLLELLMLGIVVVLLYVPDHHFENGCQLKRHLAAFAIVLGWATFITLVGRHPKLSRYNIYVTMFFKVLSSFILFLTWYSFFIIAFGLGFYIMLHKDVPNHSPGEDDYKFFDDPWLSLVKTGTMFIGELEFSDIPVDVNSRVAVLAYIFLLSFVFLIVVVLMNLLNGLAVSDTGIIREEAEIVTYISRVETISCTEAVLLGDPFNFLSNWPAIAALRNLPSLAFCRSIYKNSLIRNISHKITGATGILLFYTWLPNKELVLQPNRHKNRFGCMSMEVMGDEVIQAAKNIVIKKDLSNHEAGFAVAERLARLEVGQGRLQENLENLQQKMDLLLCKLNT